MNQPIFFDLSRLSPEGSEAYQTLLQTNIFAIGPVGFAGVISKSEIALSILISDRESIDALKSLIYQALPAGQLYGLCGIYIKYPNIFSQEVQHFKVRYESDALVLTQSGCIVNQTNTQEIVKKIELGYYSSISNHDFPESK